MSSNKADRNKESDTQDFMFRTVFEKHNDTGIDTKNITTPADLAALKVGDPFLYHSIPAVKKAELEFKEVDVSTLNDSTSGTGSIVKRQSKLTTEVHPDKA